MRQTEDSHIGRSADATSIGPGGIGITSPFSDLDAAKNARTSVNLANRANNTNNIANVNQQTGGGGGTNIIPIPIYRPAQPAPRQTYPIVLPWANPYGYPGYYPQATSAATGAPSSSQSETNALLGALLAQQQQPIVSLSSGMSTPTLVSSVAAVAIIGIVIFLLVKKAKK